jgi:AraC-like DNA-binding protein
MQIIEPASCLTPYIKAFMIVESNDERSNRLLPDTALVMAIRYKGTVRYIHEESNRYLPAFSLSGLRRSSSIVHYSRDSGNILVQFKSTGAAAFFPQPLHELFASNISLDNFFSPSELRALEDQVYCPGTIEHKVKIVEQFLISKLNYQAPDLLIAGAIQKIQSTGGLLKIRQLADSLAISHDAFEKRFRKTVGATPKQYASIVRMKTLINQLQLNEPLTTLALEAGFFDQSHFIREFKRFTGQTPTDFLVAENR